MKKYFIISTLLVLSLSTYSQFYYYLHLDPPNYGTEVNSYSKIFIDTVSNHDCLWQIGQPSKTIFNSAYSAPNSIVTDTINFIPINDTSIFFIKHLRQTQPWHRFILSFWYQLDGDTTDYGIIEISPDSGNTWINVFEEDTMYNMYWITPKPCISGSTDDWKYFSLNMTDWASGWGSFPIEMTADTILFRFTYITDSIPTNRDGWIIDNFHLEDWCESIEESNNFGLVSLYPNPTNNELNIKVNEHCIGQSIQIYSFSGKLVYQDLDFKGDPVNVANLRNGLYILRYSDTKNISFNKFVISR